MIPLLWELEGRALGLYEGAALKSNSIQGFHP